MEDLELEEKFKNLWLDEDNAGAAAGGDSASAADVVTVR